MDVKDTTTYETDPYFVPFYPHSVSVISASTNSGKTTLLLNIIKNRNLCFVRPFNKVVVVLCNQKVDGTPYLELADDSLSVEVCYLEEFIPDEHLSPNVLLIFEDVDTLSKEILACINVNAHHSDLASLFIVCQSIFAEEDFKLLLSLAHRIFIYFSGTGGTKLANYIRQYFFVNSELKQYFKSIISFAEINNNLVLFELNEIARKDKPHYLAIAGFEHFFNQEETDQNEEEEEEQTENMSSSPMKPVVFPHFHKKNMYKRFDNNEAQVEGIDPSTLPRGSYLLVKAENVTQKNNKYKTLNSDETDCEKDWKMVNDIIIDDIESGLKFNKQQTAKNLAKSMLNSKHFCISKDGKSVMVKDQPKTTSSLLDFLNTASRASGPNEIADPHFVLFTKLLLQSKTPKFYFKNKSLFNNPTSRQKSILKLKKKMLKMPPNYV